MKKLWIFIVMIFLISCEKETCLECTTKVIDNDIGLVFVESTVIHCDNFTRDEIKRLESTIHTEPGSKAYVITTCKEI